MAGSVAWYGAVRSSESVTPSTWNVTPTTPTLSLAVAVRFTAPESPVVPSVGAVSWTVGGVPSAPGATTVTLTGAEVVVAPPLSVARAVRLCAPSVLGVQVTA